MTTINNMHEARGEQPWWFVRKSLLAVFAVLTLLLVAILTPTPLNAWVFGGEFAITLAGQ